MKKYLFAAILMLCCSGLFAQGVHETQERADRKGRKMEKKEMKIHRKMFRDHGWKASKKQEKARKKEYKMNQKPGNPNH